MGPWGVIMITVSGRAAAISAESFFKDSTVRRTSAISRPPTSGIIRGGWGEIPPTTMLMESSLPGICSILLILSYNRFRVIHLILKFYLHIIEKSLLHVIFSREIKIPTPSENFPFLSGRAFPRAGENYYRAERYDIIPR
jgi:hypothetical protein